jgi:CDP-glucose 4,6-dehydratase
MSKNVLITGANGFVGANLAIDQIARGHHVVGIIKDRNRKTRRDVLNRCSIVFGDIRNQEVVDNVMSHYEIDTVYHLAANSIVKMGVKDPVSNFDINVMGTVKVLDAARRINPEAKIVVASSDKAYGDHDVMPYTEDMKLNPGCPYSTSKSCTDMVSQSFAKTYGLNVNTVRCSNIYGPGDMNLSRLIPNSIMRILRGEKPMIYSGVADYRREFIYIADVCNAYNLIAAKGEPGEIYNIGINSFSTIEEIVNLISDTMGGAGVDVVEKDFPEIPHQWMDGSKIAKMGWEAKVDLITGISNCVEWYTQREKQSSDAQEWATKELK